MTLTIRIFGIGVGKYIWFKLKHIIKDCIPSDQFSFEFLYSDERGKESNSGILKQLTSFKPQLVILSLSYFENLGALERLFQEYQESQESVLPEVFVIEKNLKSAIKNYLVNNSSVFFVFREQEPIQFSTEKLIDVSTKSIQAQKQLASKVEIDIAQKKIHFLSKNKEKVFYPGESIEKIVKKGKNYTFSEFVDHEIGDSDIKKELKGIFQDKGNQYLINGFPLNGLQEIRARGLSINMLADKKSIFSDTSVNQAFIERIGEACRNQANYFMGNRFVKLDEYLRKNIPITICTDFPVVGHILKQIFEADGFRHVVTIDEGIEVKNRFLLHIDNDDCENNVLCTSLPLEKKILDIPGFPNVTDEIATRKVSPTDINSPAALQSRRKQIIKKIEKLDGQIKNLSSSKVLADQEKYMNLLASRKLEIITVLLELASTWDESNDNVVNTYEEDVLVFHDDDLHGAAINKRLNGDGRRLFLNVLKYFDDIRSFLTLNTDIYEPFLHEGIIICSLSSKSYLSKKLQEIQAELEEKKSPDISLSLEKYKVEKENEQNKLIGLAYQEAVSELWDYYRKNNELIIETFTQAIQHLNQLRFAMNRVREICILASSETSADVIIEGFRRLFAFSTNVRFHVINEHLELQTDDQSVISLVESKREMAPQKVKKEINRTNIKQLSGFIEKTIGQLKQIPSDFIVIEQDLFLLKLLVRVLREKTAEFELTPIVGLFSGTFDTGAIAYLVNEGIRISYLDVTRWNDQDYVSRQLAVALDSGLSSLN